MASGAPNRERWFITAGQGFHGVLLGSWVFFLDLEHSWRWGGRCLRRLLETLLHSVSFAWLLSHPMWGWCGCASLPPTPSYDLQPSDKGMGLLVRYWLVSSLQSVVAPFWMMWSPRAWIFGAVLTVWVPVQSNLTWCTSFLLGPVYLMSDSLWCYSYTPGRITILDSEGADPNTWVYAVRLAWAPVAASHFTWRQIPPPPEALTLVVLIW
jgi:hypothetical protein